jgi:hypothetical protein
LVGYIMSMGLRHKFQMFAAGLLVALMATFALAVAAAPAAGPAAQADSVAIPAMPEHAPTCFERPRHCGAGGVASAPASSVPLAAMRGTGLVKAPALATVPMPDVAPHAAASLSILFRNFRE